MNDSQLDQNLSALAKLEIATSPPSLRDQVWLKIRQTQSLSFFSWMEVTIFNGRYAIATLCLAMLFGIGFGHWYESDGRQQTHIQAVLGLEVFGSPKLLNRP